MSIYNVEANFDIWHRSWNSESTLCRTQNLLQVRFEFKVLSTANQNCRSKPHLQIILNPVWIEPIDRYLVLQINTANKTAAANWIEPSSNQNQVWCNTSGLILFGLVSSSCRFDYGIPHFLTETVIQSTVSYQHGTNTPNWNRRFS